MTGRGPAQVVVDTSAPVPPYEQIRRQVAAQAASGVLAPGERLPSVRQLAADLGVAPGTVARAYRHLEGDGVVTTKLRGGTRIVDQPHRLPASERASRVASLATAYVRSAALLGADGAETVRAVEEVLRSGTAGQSSARDD
jgi:DNA-binding transcriptional regulator YhcF (GntR family)